MALMKDGDKPHVPAFAIIERFDILPTDNVSFDQVNWRHTYQARFSELADRLNFTVADSREKSLALTALEEAAMWADKAILREPEVR